MEVFRTSLLSDCSLMKTVTSTKKSWCAGLPIRKRKIKSIASSNWIDGRLLLQQVQKAILHATHQSPNVDRLNITEVQISMQKKKCWQIQLNGKNQPNHRSEPAEPLDSPHESPISKRKICSRRRPSTRTFVWIFANMRHLFRTSSPGLYENCNFRFAKFIKRPYTLPFLPLFLKKQLYWQLACQPGVARAFALRASGRLRSAFSLRDHSSQRWTLGKIALPLLWRRCPGIRASRDLYMYVTWIL